MKKICVDIMDGDRFVAQFEMMIDPAFWKAEDVEREAFRRFPATMKGLQSYDDVTYYVNANATPRTRLFKLNNHGRERKNRKDA